MRNDTPKREQNRKDFGWPFDLIFLIEREIKAMSAEECVMFRFFNVGVVGLVCATFAFSAPAHATFNYGFVNRALDRLDAGQTPQQICRHWAGFKYRSDRLASLIGEYDDDDRRVRHYKVRRANMHRNGNRFFKYHRCVRFVTVLESHSPHNSQ